MSFIICLVIKVSNTINTMYFSGVSILISYYLLYTYQLSEYQTINELTHTNKINHIQYKQKTSTKHF